MSCLEAIYLIKFFSWSQVMASTAQYNNKMLIIETFLKETDKISVLLPFINQSIHFLVK